MSKFDIWQWAVYLLPILSYLIGAARNRITVPKEIRSLLANREVMGLVAQGICTAASIEGKSDAEKREYAREWAASELRKLLGERLPDSAINYLIEHIIVSGKKAE